MKKRRKPVLLREKKIKRAFSLTVLHCEIYLFAFFFFKPCQIGFSESEQRKDPRGFQHKQLFTTKTFLGGPQVYHDPDRKKSWSNAQELVMKRTFRYKRFYCRVANKQKSCKTFIYYLLKAVLVLSYCSFYLHIKQLISF